MLARQSTTHHALNQNDTFSFFMVRLNWVMYLVRAGNLCHYTSHLTGT
jgi:hypothetical protein